MAKRVESFMVLASRLLDVEECGGCVHLKVFHVGL